MQIVAVDVIPTRPIPRMIKALPKLVKYSNKVIDMNVAMHHTHPAAIRCSS